MGGTLAPVISHVQPLEKGQAVFQDIISGQSDTMKVLLQMQG